MSPANPNADAREAATTNDGRPTRLAWQLLLIPTLLATVVFLVAASQRVFYPHDLEWMEGALADHAYRIFDGHPLYCAPTADHVPFLYAPLLFWLGALGISVGLDGLIALRLIAATATVACAMLIGHWVRRDSGRLLPGLVATGLFFAGYGWLAWWYDLARNDSLFVFLCLATTYQLLHGGRRRWLWSGLLACLAVLAKQSALMWLPAMGVGALLWNWRIAVRFCATATLSMLLVFCTMHISSAGWSTFYLFEMPRHHGFVSTKLTGYWTTDVQPMYPLLLLGVIGFAARLRRDPRSALVLAAFGSGGLLASWFSRLHAGGFDNVLMYGFAAACVLAPLAAARMQHTTTQVLAAATLLLAFGWLGYAAIERKPAETLLPDIAHRHAHEQLAAYVAAQQGPVWLPAHGHVGRRAVTDGPDGSSGSGAHGQAIFDILQLLPRTEGAFFDLDALQRIDQLEHLSERARTALRHFRDDVHTALDERRFRAIVLDAPSPKGPGTAIFEHPQLFGRSLIGPDLRPGTDDDRYRRRTTAIVDDANAIRTLIGFDIRNPYALEARR